MDQSCHFEVCLALQGQYLVLGVLSGHRRHPGLLGRGQFQQIRPAAGRDEEMSL